MQCHFRSSPPPSPCRLSCPASGTSVPASNPQLMSCCYPRWKHEAPCYEMDLATFRFGVSKDFQPLLRWRRMRACRQVIAARMQAGLIGQAPFCESFTNFYGYICGYMSWGSCMQLGQEYDPMASSYQGTAGFPCQAGCRTSVWIYLRILPGRKSARQASVWVVTTPGCHHRRLPLIGRLSLHAALLRSSLSRGASMCLLTCSLLRKFALLENVGHILSGDQRDPYELHFWRSLMVVCTVVVSASPRPSTPLKRESTGKV